MRFTFGPCGTANEELVPLPWPQIQNAAESKEAADGEGDQ